MIQTTEVSITYKGDGVQTSFPYPYPYRNSDDIVGYIINDVGYEKRITNNFKYDKVSNIYQYPLAGDPLAAPYSIKLIRETPQQQNADLPGKLPFSLIEKSLDWIIMILQEIGSRCNSLWHIRNDCKLSETNARNSASAAAESEENAANSEDMAKKWAMSPISPDGVVDTNSPTGYTQSAKIWAALSKEYAGLSKFKLPIGYYNSVSEMRVSETAIVGRPCVTLGYYEPNDGGGGVYILRQKKEGDVDDGGSVIFLDNNNVAELIIEGAVNVKQFGAHGDGTTDDTTSINSALALGKNTVFPKATYLVSSPLILQPYTCVDLCSSIIVGSNADADIFLFSRELNPTESLTLQNGIIRGKYTNAIHLKGKNEWGHAPSNYTHKVRIDNILAYCDADAPDENTFLFLDTACKRLNITRCGAETKNCIISNGKTVESFISGCMLYATGSTGYAVKVYSDFTNGNGIVSSKWMYAEGLKFVNCEIDNPHNKGVSFLISDSFVTLIENCYIGCSMEIAPPINTSSNTDIIIADNVIYGATLNIGDSTFTKNNIYRCKVVNNNFDNSRIMLYEGTNIEIANNTFYTGNNYTYDTAIYLGRNSSNITVHDNSIYGMYKIGVICKSSPINAAVYNIDYNGIGTYGLHIEDDTKNTVYRHHIRGGESPIMYTNIPLNSKIDVGGTIASVTVSLAKGQTGYITGVINTTEATSDARIMVGAPDKIGILHGENWDSRYIYVDNGTNRIPIRIPFKCTDDFSGTIKLINSIGGKSVKITTSYHSYFGVELT